MTKMFRHAKSFGLVAASAGLIFALLLGSVVPAKAAEERVVKIGLHAAWTGVLATEPFLSIQKALHLHSIRKGRPL